MSTVTDGITTPVEVQLPEQKSATDMRKEAEGLYPDELERPEYNAPVAQHTVGSYGDLLRMSAPKQPTAEQEKRRKINETIAMAGDALTGLISAAGAINGGNAMAIDPSQTMTAQAKARYDKYLESQKADRQNYYNLMMKAISQENSDNAAAQRAYDKYYNSQMNNYKDYQTKRENAIKAYVENGKYDNDKAMEIAKAKQQQENFITNVNNDAYKFNKSEQGKDARNDKSIKARGNGTKKSGGKTKTVTQHTDGTTGITDTTTSVTTRY